MTNQKMVLFWRECRGEKIDRGCFSQWQKAPFEIDGVRYLCAEQYMMAEKARLFGDEEQLEKILKAKTPRTMKAQGRKVKGFDPVKWNDAKFDIVVRGNKAKFSQNPNMLAFLLGTGNDTLAEASPYDKIWGIGLSEASADALDPATWKGQNLLGKALMKVRSELAKTKIGKEIIEKPPAEYLAGVEAFESVAERREKYAEREVRKAKLEVSRAARLGMSVEQFRALPKDERVRLVREENAAERQRRAVRGARRIATEKPKLQRGKRQDGLKDVSNAVAKNPELLKKKRELKEKMREEDFGSSRLFIDTRTSLLRRLNAGDQEAFNEFYELYSPAMFKYLGKLPYGEQKDVVQTVFLNFYKLFCMVEDPDTGIRRIPKSIFDALTKTNEDTGEKTQIKFRQYLITSMKNLKVKIYNKQTKNGKVEISSLNTVINKESQQELIDILEDPTVSPEVIEDDAAEAERREAMEKVWDVVMQAFLLDNAVEDMTRDIFYSLITEKSTEKELAEKWDTSISYIRKVKSLNLQKAALAAKRIYDFIGGPKGNYAREVGRLWKAISEKKVKHFGPFMVNLAKEVCKGYTA